MTRHRCGAKGRVVTLRSAAVVFGTLAVCAHGADLLSLPANYVCDPIPTKGSKDYVPRFDEEEWPLCAPQMIIAGAEKSGTTSAYEYLKAHPDFLPLTGTHMLPRPERARIIRTLIQRASKTKGQGGKDPKQDPRFDRKRWRRLANLTAEEIRNAELMGEFSLKEIRFPELESYAIPIRMGKEVRFFSSWVPPVMKDLGVSPNKAAGFYYDVFPRIPAPASGPCSAAKKGSLLDASCGRTAEALSKAGLTLEAEPPAHLAANVGKVTGEASPQYLDKAPYAPKSIRNFMPNTRLVFMLREPVRRYWSQGRMVDSMKGPPHDPDIHDFEKNVWRCLGNDPEDKQKKLAHNTIKSNTVPGGGAVARMRKINWLGDLGQAMKQFETLKKDLDDCFTHRLSQFLVKGDYALTLNQWVDSSMGNYPREQMLVVASEELYTDPVGAMHSIADFVGLRRIDDEIWREATSWRHNPYFDIKNLEFSLNVTKAPGTSSKNSGLSGMSEKTQKLLEGFYAGPNCALRKLLGVDFSKWGWVYCDAPSTEHSLEL